MADMTSDFRFDDQVVIITGAGMGLGRSHAHLFASLGAKVLVNDLGTATDGTGASTRIADAVVDEIRAAGGFAIANHDSVEQGQRLVEQALDEWGSIAVVINNAGIIRDASFHKLQLEDWLAVQRVNLEGAFRVTHAAWPHLRANRYGRVLFTASAAGIYGNFGQANYGSAKLGLHGLARSLAVEGSSRNIHVNTIAPMLDSRLLEGLMPDALRSRLRPQLVSPLAAYLCHASCRETGGLFEVGGGWYGKLRWQRSDGAALPLDRPVDIQAIADHWPAIVDFELAQCPETVEEAGRALLRNALAELESAR